jgi:hypothetical protein
MSSQLKLPVWFAMVATIVTFAQPAHARKQPHCALLASAEPERLFQYLRGDRSKLQPSCIEFALSRLGPARYRPSLELLISYLDFRSPEASQLTDGIVLNVQWPLAEEFPAALAVFDFGVEASEALVRAIKDPALPELVRINAAEVLFMANPDRSRAIVALAEAAEIEGQVDSGQRLHDLAKQLAGRCRWPENRVACEEALVPGLRKRPG